jgi:hypothetical protein
MAKMSMATHVAFAIRDQVRPLAAYWRRGYD